MSERFAFRYSGLCDKTIKTAFQEDVNEALQQRYSSAGSKDALIANRVQEEWNEIVNHNSILDMAALYDICLWLKENRLTYKITDASAGASFILYLLGVTRGNPLPPHIYNPLTGAVHHLPEYADGFDIPSKKLYIGGEWIADGHDIPWQSFFWAGSCRNKLLPDVTITIYVDDIDFDELQLLTAHWSSRQKDDYRVMPLKLCKSKLEHEIRDHVTSDIDRFCISEAINFVSRITNDADMRNYYHPDFEEMETLYPLPEPQSFAEAIRFYGIFRGEGMHNYYSMLMLEEFNMRLQIPAFTEDIYAYLLRHGFSVEEAWKSSRDLINGGVMPALSNEMKNAGDYWFYQCCQPIKKAISKAEAVEEVLFAADVAKG